MTDAVTYRVTSPRSRTDRAADILWTHLRGKASIGLSSSEMHLVDVVKYRVRRVKPETMGLIDRHLTEAGYGPLRWTPER